MERWEKQKQYGKHYIKKKLKFCLKNVKDKVKKQNFSVLGRCRQWQ